MHRYMFQSSTDNSRHTATTSTVPKPTSKWVINISNNPLTETQEKFMITLQSPPTGEYIAAVEQTCHSLAQGKAEELRAEVNAVLKKIQPPRSNISREEQMALKKLRRITPG